MENEMSIERMVARSAAGETAAFRLLFDLVHDELFRFIRAKVPTRDDALDILQDVFVDFWEALRKGKFTYTSESAFYGFLYTVARRKIARTYQARKPVMSLEDVEDASPDMPDKEDAILVLRSVEKLNSSDQEVIRLRYFAGLPFSRIAALLGMEEGTVRVRHHRAITRLQEILGYE